MLPSTDKFASQREADLIPRLKELINLRDAAIATTNHQVDIVTAKNETLRANIDQVSRIQLSIIATYVSSFIVSMCTERYICNVFRKM